MKGGPGMPRAFSTITGLGSPVQFYPLKLRGIYKSVTASLAVVGIGAGIVILFVGGLQTYWSYYYHGPSVVMKNLTLPLILGVLLLIFGALAVWAAYSRWIISVVIFEKGLACRDRKGMHAWPWEEISSIRTQLTQSPLGALGGRTRHVYILTKTDGDRIILDDSIDRVEDLAENLRSIILPAIFRKYTASFYQGISLQFGPIIIDKDRGTKIEDRWYSWRQIREASIQSGAAIFIIQDEGKPARRIKIPVAQIPDVDVCISLINQMLTPEAVLEG
ncbi:MAG: hypothetical protein M1281_10835 [Chloroflexi bacterium]|nr:hypothetical protein [Chloroflexota bacterium]